MAPNIKMQEAVGVECELKSYLSEEESGTTASLAPSDSSEVSSARTLWGFETEDKGEVVDVEKAATEALGRQSAKRTSRVHLLVWMTLNTVATVSIVSENTHSVKDQDSCISGLYEQSHLRRLVVSALPSGLRRLPSLRDGIDTLHPLSPKLWHVRSGLD